MEYLIAFMLAFVLAFFFTPIAKRIAFLCNAIDVPKDLRRMHQTPIALMGGLAIVVGFFGSVLYCSLAMEGFPNDSRQLNGLFLGAIVILAMGILDDIFCLRPIIKLVFQFGAAVTVVLTSDTLIENVTLFFVGNGSDQMMALDPIVSWLATVLWIVAIINAINFIDGLDGLSAGTSAICALSLFAVSFVRTDIAPQAAMHLMIVTIGLCGACLGFLPYNFNPARIFMGETGASFLGYVLGVISVQGTLKSYAAISIFLPVLILGIPLFDAVFAFLRRIKNRKPISQGDRGHLHHRLIDMGLSQKWSVLTLYVASAALGISAIALAGNELRYSTYLILIMSVLIITGIRLMSGFTQKTMEQTDSENVSGQMIKGYKRGEFVRTRSDIVSTAASNIRRMQKNRMRPPRRRMR